MDTTHASDITTSDILEAMQQYGGSFVKALAECYCVADEVNRTKLWKVFGKEWRQYRDLVKLKRGAR